MCYCIGACFLLHTHTLKSQGIRVSLVLIVGGVGSHLCCCKIKYFVECECVKDSWEKLPFAAFPAGSHWHPSHTVSLSLCYYLTHTHTHTAIIKALLLLCLTCAARARTHTTTHTTPHTRVLPSTSWKTAERRESERWEKKVIIFCVILPSDLCPPFCQPPTGSWK